MKKLLICCSVLLIVCFATCTYATILLPVADGHFLSTGVLCCLKACDVIVVFYETRYDSIKVGLSTYNCDPPPVGDWSYCCNFNMEDGIIEFDLSSIIGLFTIGQMQANLSLTLKNGELINDECLSLYYIIDENENGILEIEDDISIWVEEICPRIQPGDTITFDATPAVEHFLFDNNQTMLSGFRLGIFPWVVDSIEFYDHTDSENAPRLSVYGIDSDGDGIPDNIDNCPEIPNLDQLDTYPPQGNNIGDVCECEGNFDCDGDVDGSDAAKFKLDFGRTGFNNPCSNEDSCNGDFDCDVDVDGSDAARFKEDFGRSPFFNSCSYCFMDPWCEYIPTTTTSISDMAPCDLYQCGPNYCCCDAEMINPPYIIDGQYCFLRTSCVDIPHINQHCLD